MHLPYVRKIFKEFVVLCASACDQFLKVYSKDIKIVPIVVGAINKEKEAAFGEILAPYLADKDTMFVISSDFCHWLVELIGRVVSYL
jgi:MEMO1 family protein